MGEKVMRNADALRKVADEIEANGETRPKFNMDVWYDVTNIKEYEEGHECGTSACIAGYTVFTCKPKEYRYGTDFLTLGMECLGLSRYEAYGLFETSFDATEEDAVAYLRYLADNPDAIIVSDWARRRPWEKKS